MCSVCNYIYCNKKHFYRERDKRSDMIKYLNSFEADHDVIQSCNKCSKQVCNNCCTLNINIQSLSNQHIKRSRICFTCEVDTHYHTYLTSLVGHDLKTIIDKYIG